MQRWHTHVLSRMFSLSECTMYYICAHGDPEERTCPRLTVWDTDKDVCNWPSDVSREQCRNVTFNTKDSENYSNEIVGEAAEQVQSEDSRRSSTSSVAAVTSTTAQSPVAPGESTTSVSDSGSSSSVAVDNDAANRIKETNGETKSVS